MKLLPSRVKGFSLAEVLVALGISMVLMGALAGVFASSVTTRQQVDRDGQKIENARFSLGALSEDIRLAGYFGNYTPAGKWSSVSWQPVTPIEKVSGNCTAAAMTTGWANFGTGTVKIPSPIMGLEAHTGSTTQTINANLTDCLPGYLSGTDVLVVRRARTTGATSGALTAAKTYLQVSACSTEVGTNDFQVGLGSATFALKRLGCATTPVAPIWELMTHVYYVASENESGDNIPTLKMIDLSSSSGTMTAAQITAVTSIIAPGVVDFHLEYGIDTTADGSSDTYTVSTTDPQRLLPDGATTTGTALAAPWGGATNWHDVVAAKLWVVVRDPESTNGYTNAKDYSLGSIAVSAATVNSRPSANCCAAYRYKSVGTTVKVVNMSGRREDAIP